MDPLSYIIKNPAAPSQKLILSSCGTCNSTAHESHTAVHTLRCFHSFPAYLIPQVHLSQAERDQQMAEAAAAALESEALAAREDRERRREVLHSSLQRRVSDGGRCCTAHCRGG